MSGNLPASIRAQLKNHADANGQDFNLILTRYGLERLMFRLSQSAHASNFLLKGALAFGLWFDLPHRPTRDADLLGFGDDNPDAIAAIFRELCALEVPDGLKFDSSSVQARESRLKAKRDDASSTRLAMAYAVTNSAAEHPWKNLADRSCTRIERMGLSPP